MEREEAIIPLDECSWQGRQLEPKLPFQVFKERLSFRLQGANNCKLLYTSIVDANNVVRRNLSAQYGDFNEVIFPEKKTKVLLRSHFTPILTFVSRLNSVKVRRHFRCRIRSISLDGFFIE